MFKPNVVGTPVIHQISNQSSASNATLGNDDPATTTYRANNINAVPVGDFGESHLYYTGTSAVTAGRRFAIGQALTIVQPINGNVRGLELNGAMTAKVPHGLQVTPFFAKLTAVPAGLMALTALSFPTIFKHQFIPLASDTLVFKHFSYKETLIMQDPTAIDGTYIHGFLCNDNSAAGWNLIMMHMMASTRQLNDQNEIEYADTRR